MSINRRFPKMQPYYMRCHLCGEVFLKKHWKQKFCSKECRSIAQKKKDAARERIAEKKRQERLAALAEKIEKAKPEPPKPEKPKPVSIFIHCEDCGVPIAKTHGNKKYCDKCRERRIRESKAREKAKRQKTYVNEQDMQKSKGCEVADRCFYGGVFDNKMSCDYYGKTGQFRTIGANKGLHRIINGKCDLFTPSKKKKGGSNESIDSL